MAGETIEELLASGAVVPDRPGSKRLVPATRSVVVPVEADGPIASAIAASIRKNVPGEPYADSGIGRLIWRDALAAAPAPSSLEGGDRIGAKSRLGVIAAGKTISEAYHPSTFSEPAAQFWRDIAALSPEAPAREGVVHQTVGPIDYDKLRSIIHSATNAVLPFAHAPMKTPFSTQERAGMQVEIADLIVADLEKAGGRTPALTPRHEAPAPRPELAPYTEDLKGIKAAMLADEAPAEGAGKVLAAAERVVAAAFVYEDNELFADSQTVLSALRARSSAPEAREGEVGEL